MSNKVFVKHYAPYNFFVTKVVYNWINQFKIRCTNV